MILDARILGVHRYSCHARAFRLSCSNAIELVVIVHTMMANERAFKSSRVLLKVAGILRRLRLCASR